MIYAIHAFRHTIDDDDATCHKAFRLCGWVGCSAGFWVFKHPTYIYQMFSMDFVYINFYFLLLLRIMFDERLNNNLTCDGCIVAKLSNLFVSVSHFCIFQFGALQAMPMGNYWPDSSCNGEVFGLKMWMPTVNASNKFRRQ